MSEGDSDECEWESLPDGGYIPAARNGEFADARAKEAISAAHYDPLYGGHAGLIRA